MRWTIVYFDEARGLALVYRYEDGRLASRERFEDVMAVEVGAAALQSRGLGSGLVMYSLEGWPGVEKRGRLLRLGARG